MKLLFLDDDKNRTKKAVSHYSLRYEVYDVETAQQAIQVLDAISPFDVVSLDHDLGGQVYCPSDDNSGYAVAKHIASMPEDKKPKIVIVHSFNPVGADNMLAVLDGKVVARRKPFNL